MAIVNHTWVDFGMFIFFNCFFKVKIITYNSGRDFTDGYGPEEFMIRKAFPGKFIIKSHYYSCHQQSLSGACTLLCTIFTHYGTPKEQKQIIAVRLSEDNDDVTIGEIDFQG